MLPYAFDYTRAGSVAEAVTLLAEHGDDARLLAGGHSLIPAMKLRLAAPATLIDISGIAELSAITDEGDAVRVGALATHRAVEHSEVVRARCFALAEAAGQIGDPQVRNRGTIGGSLAHADPASDYPALVLALDAVIEATGPSGARSIAAEDFFEDLFTTALEPGEMITAVRFPAVGAGMGAAYAKFHNPASRYPIVGVCACVEVDASGTCRGARIGVTGAAPSAYRASAFEAALAGKRLTGEVVSAAVRGNVEPDEPMSDLYASAEYRMHLCEVMAQRAVAVAGRRAARDGRRPSDV